MASAVGTHGVTIVVIGTESAFESVRLKLGADGSCQVLWCQSTTDLHLLAAARALLTPGDPASSDPPGAGHCVRFGAASIDPITGELVGPVARARLTSTERRLAEYLYFAGGPRTAKRIAGELFARTDASGENLVHKHVGNLRKKLARAGVAPHLLERIALGYQLPRATKKTG